MRQRLGQPSGPTVQLPRQTVCGRVGRARVENELYLGERAVAVTVVGE